MNEHILRSQTFEAELLARHGAASLADIGLRELEAFRAGASLAVIDAAWLLLLGRWKSAHDEPVVSVSELETWPDANLYDLLRRDDTLPNVRESAALELYRRGSPHVRSEEFTPFKTLCIDREMAERKARHDPVRVLDSLQRLAERSDINATTIAKVDSSHHQAEADLEAQTTAAIQTLQAMLEARTSSLTQAFTAANDTLAAQLAKTTRRFLWWCSGLSLATVLIIAAHFLL